MSMRSQVQTRSTVAGLNVGTGLELLAGIVGAVFSFFHWYGVTPANGATTYLNGWHGWGIPTAVLLIVAALVALGRLVGMAVAPHRIEAGIMIVAGLAAVVCSIIFMVTEGSGYGSGYDKGPLFGAWIGLICGIAVVVGGILQPKDATV